MSGTAVLRAHCYDRKRDDPSSVETWKNIITRVEKEIAGVTAKRKTEAFTRLGAEIAIYSQSFPEASQLCRCALRMLGCINEAIGNSPNYAAGNRLYADDILYTICQERTEDTLPTLVEQLSDTLTSGQCPEGRVARLMMVLHSMVPLEK